MGTRFNNLKTHERQKVKEISFDHLSDLCVSHIAATFDISDDFSSMLVNSLWNTFGHIQDIEKCWYIEQYIKRNPDIINIGNELDELNDLLPGINILDAQFRTIVWRMHSLNLELARALASP